jgi:sarcosine oxidase
VFDRSAEPYSGRVSCHSTEVAVVGAGVSGLSAAHALRRRGVGCRVFEAGVPGAGQSAGRTRVFRHGHDDERLTRLAVRAREEWVRLEAELGASLLGRQGVLICGPTGGGRAAAFEAAGVPARVLGRDEQVAALSALTPPEDEALLDELGGGIDVRAVVDGLAWALADQLVTAEVFAVRERGGHVELQTSEGLWEAGRAIVCPGAGLHELTAELGLDIPLTLDLHARAAFAVREPGAALACLQDRSGAHGEIVYGAPMPDGRHYAVGLGGEHEPPVDEAIARLTAYVERALPGLDPEPASVRLCRTSILPWGADAFATWRAGNVDALAGANLFKFGPLLGELLADRSDELLPDAQLGRARTAAGQPSSPSA